MSITKRVLLLVVIFSVVIANILNKKYTDYTLYFAIPSIFFIVFLIFKVIKESDSEV